MTKVRIVEFLTLLGVVWFFFACLLGCKTEGDIPVAKGSKAVQWNKTLDSKLGTLSAMDSDSLVQFLNRPIPRLLSSPYPFAFDKSEDSREIIEGAYDGDMPLLYEAALFSRAGGPFSSLSDEESIDLVMKRFAFKCLAEKDIVKGLSWFRGSAGKSPTVMDALYVQAIAEVVGVEPGRKLEDIRSSWTALLTEGNLLLFTAGLHRADEFASDEECLRAFDRATKTEWPGLHATAIEMLRVRSRTRETLGAAAALGKYLQKLEEAPFSQERKDSLRQDAAKLLEELKTPR